MTNHDFDERYPAIFQPGGEGRTDASVTGDGKEAAAGSNQQEQPAGHGPASTGADAGAPQNAGPAPQNATPAPQQSEAKEQPAAAQQSKPWPPHLWIVSLAAAVVMIAAGVFALTVQHWLPSSTEIDPADFSGIELQPWGHIIFTAAPPLIGAGVGILAAMLFLASRGSAPRETTLRRAFAVLTLAVGAAGWTALFATAIFPGVAATWAGGYTSRPVMPWTYLVSFTGVWLFSLALLMLASLIVVPRQWQGPPDEPDQSDNQDHTDDGGMQEGARPSGTLRSLGRPSVMRGLFFGTAAALAGMFVLFSPYIFPEATGMVMVELPDGSQATHQDWAVTAQALVTPLLAAGFMVLAWSLVTLAVTLRESPVAGRKRKTADGVEL